MTNKQAAERLRYNYPDECYPKLCKAYDVAIKALEQPEPCQDAISRRAAISAITSHSGVVDKSVAKRILVQLPSVQPERKWIPCRERVPEVGDYVICSQENGDVGEGKLLPDGNWLILYESAEYGTRWVTAWMPLPEPYRETEP